MPWPVLDAAKAEGTSVSAWITTAARRALLADKLAAAAEDIAAKAELARLAPCAAASPDAACAREAIVSFGERAFRRPLDDDDVERYVALVASAPDVTTGLRTLISAMLQSPHFLYRRELGTRRADGDYALSDYEIASELSYQLWQTMPDEALFADAAAGKLHEPNDVQAAVTRMLKSPKARGSLRAFVLEWLGLSAILTVPKDTQQFPELTMAVREAMLGEVERFVDAALAGGGALDALLTGTTTFVDPTLAEFYGVSLPSGAADAQGFVSAELPADERVGVLTLGGTMMRHARSNDSSPVHRGRLVRERLLCQVPPPPPPGIVIEPPALDPSKTTRERYAAHASVEPCKGCHKLMDKIGLAFERFDGAGRHRDDDQGLPIDVSGEIVNSASSDGAFDGTTELADKLAASPDVQACFAKQWLRYAYGMPERDGRARCVTRRIQDAFALQTPTLEALVQLTTHDEQLFVRHGEASDGSGDGGESGGEGSSSDPGPADPPDPTNEPDAAAPPPPTGVTFTLTVNNDYGSGYCHTYEVLNETAEPVTWSFTAALEGTLTQHWESNVTEQPDNATFTGADYNASLEPGAKTRFGFCVEGP